MPSKRKQQEQNQGGRAHRKISKGVPTHATATGEGAGEGDEERTGGPAEPAWVQALRVEYRRPTGPIHTIVKKKINSRLSQQVRQKPMRSRRAASNTEKCAVEVEKLQPGGLGGRLGGEGRAEGAPQAPHQTPQATQEQHSWAGPEGREGFNGKEYG